MSGFTKLFNSILYSTIWQEPNATRILWITMLAMSDKNGEIMASVPGLAKMAGITIPECRDGLKAFMSPDLDSRTPDYEGRRIQTIDGGWNLLNHGKYRALLSAEERREYNRKKQAERRAGMKNNVNDVSMTVNDNQQCQHIAEAEAEAEAEAKIKEPLSTSGRDGDPIQPSGQIAYPEAIRTMWQIFPPKCRERSSQKKVHEMWQKTKLKPDMSLVIESLKLWANCHEWTKDGGQFAPGAHLWIKDRKWESESPCQKNEDAGGNVFAALGRTLADDELGGRKSKDTEEEKDQATFY